MNLPFTLSVEPSRIKNAGFGVFVRPLDTSTFPHAIKQGTVMALYPGVVYSPADPVFFPSISNHYVLQRMDSSMIDGKHSGLSKYMFKSIWKRELTWNWITYDRNWLDLRKQGDCMSWSVGQLINNALNSVTDANVVYNEFTLDLSFPAEYRAFVPNVPYAPEEADIHGIALVTTQDLVFERMDQKVELLASYQSVHHGG
ncbi:SET domain-containing protein 9 [Chytriomyces hyalinus]|nr:SET domain-containing protein 9 [Chytriomyces hyalinus]